MMRTQENFATKSMNYTLKFQIKQTKMKKELVLSWVQSKRDEITQFLARMNNLAWLINLLPSKGSKPTKDDIIEQIYENIIREWDVLYPFIEKRRQERTIENTSEIFGWYMCHLEELIKYAKSRREYFRKRIEKRIKKLN